MNDLIRLSTTAALELDLNDYQMAKQAIIDHESNFPVNTIANNLDTASQTA